MTTEDVRESRRVVRLYSFEVDQRLPSGNDAHRLGQALAQDRGDIQAVTAPWRKFFDPWSPVGSSRDPITQVIEVESARLREKWMAFQGNCPKEDRLDLLKYEPTVEGVVDMVGDITKNWQSRREKGKTGKASMLFHRFCRTLNSHKNLISILPESNEYVSIFTGTLNSIIRASANHERIAEGLSEGLCTISEHITDIQGDLELFRTESMLKLVADLYEHMFLFLASTMDWIMEKRRKKLLDSFNESFNDRFVGEIRTIKVKAERVRNMAAQISQAEARVTRLTVEDLDRDVRLGLEGDARHQAEMRYFAEKIEKELIEAQRERRLESQRIKQLGNYVKLLLEERATGWMAHHRVHLKVRTAYHLVSNSGLTRC
ncbi:Phytanoyl-dioxygenase family protein [Pleurostoma richardsiae]|uniref:Phytanoyl-dioxygenase family protein n=1 Tax=Pleurostoma richardsiae TaxID=41990 RepID=A0AA38RBK6_9PEZI|nr:Phytanoyl-dioxygenase family protein [Pleurostoma richardsiae]